MYDVITIGSATLDVFLHCESLDILEKEGVKEIAFPYGSKINVLHSLFETGGGGTNTATTFARQGLTVAVLSKIGHDFPGEKVLQKLKEEHIDTQYLTQSDTDTTSFATIVWAPYKGSVIFIDRGKATLDSSDIKGGLTSRWFYISSLKGNFDVIKKVQQVSSANKDLPSLVSWNPGQQELVHQDKVLEVLPAIELLILNKRELSQLLKEDAEIDILSLLRKAHTLPCRKKLLTDGHNGSYFYNGSTWVHAGIYTADRKEATGAGDAFGSAFVAGIIKGLSEHECLKMASANAASVVQSPSAKNGILNAHQIKDWITHDLPISPISL